MTKKKDSAEKAIRDIRRATRRRHDGPDWQLDPLQRAVETEIAEAADISIQTIRMAIDSSQFAGAAISKSDADKFLGDQSDTENSDNQRDPNSSEVESQMKGDLSESRSLTVAIELGDDADEGDEQPARPGSRYWRRPIPTPLLWDKS